MQSSKTLNLYNTVYKSYLSIMVSLLDTIRLVSICQDKFFKHIISVFKYSLLVERNCIYYGIHSNQWP